MIAFAWLCLLLAPGSVRLVDQTYRIPANEWRYVEIPQNRQPALLSVQVEAREGARETRIEVLDRGDLERLRSDRPHGALAATAAGASGGLRALLQEPGQYAVVVDNRDGDTPANVHLRVWLDRSPAERMEVGSLSPRRRATVIIISFAVFFGIVTWSGRRLLRTVRK